ACIMNTPLLNGDWTAMDGLSDILNEIQSTKYPTRMTEEDIETSSPATSESVSVNTAFAFSEADLANYAMLPGSLPNMPFHFPQEERGAPLNFSEFPFCDAEREVYDELTGPTDNSIYSRKVFIGGLPKTLTAKELCHFFSEFGPVMIDWPHRERMPDRPPHGYAFAVFSRAVSVDALVNRCSVSRGKHCIYLGPYCVQVRPWVKSDREHYMAGYDEVNSARTQRYSIFIGGVARTTTARNLAETIDNAIGDVVAVRIEVDYDTEYPKGAARVIFATEKAYVTAIARRFISMASHDLHKDEYKEVEMKPYLEDCMICERCFKMSTRSFCAELRCLKYFCDMCWKVWHSSNTSSSEHRPMLKGLHQVPRYTGTTSSESYRPRGSAPPSSFASGGAHSPPSSAGPFGAAAALSAAAYWPSAAAAAMAAATARVQAGGSLRGLAGVNPYGVYPSLLATPSALLYANGALADAAAGSMGRRAGMSAAAGLRLAEMQGAYGREMGVRPPSAFGGSSSNSSLTGGVSAAPPTPSTGGFPSASASSSATTQFSFDDFNSLSPPAESPLSPFTDKSKQPNKFFGF
ncbi:hypothetical protein PFISCL1PPCAC_8241, partial [Pristionchus fissidentatus]